MTHSSTDVFLGINALNHDASVALVQQDGSQDQLLFAAHAERYSRIKNDPNLNCEMIENCLQYGKPTAVYWYDQPWLKATRKLVSGERPVYQSITKQLRRVGLGHLQVRTTRHHRAHAAMGYFTSTFRDAAVLVLDAIGEWNCTTVWAAKDNQLNLKFAVNYPHSMGLFYSAVTQALGLKPNEEEYILMGMAAYGAPIYADEMIADLFDCWNPPNLKLTANLHRGLGNYFSDRGWTNEMHIAASAQEIVQRYIRQCAAWIRAVLRKQNLVLVGGVALNCVANSMIRDTEIYQNIWVPPNPGDAGLALGAIAAHRRRHIPLDHAYLGYDINQPLDVSAVAAALKLGEIIGVANGRAEFGPRALGNRSILADPRGPHIKDQVNAIKQRQEFRPFAPVILAEKASDYFADVKHDQRFMQWTNTCLSPGDLPAVCHIDNSSRVQTVPDDGSNIRKILELWHAETGCPLLLNTSLNIKGEPLVNTWADAERFGRLHGIKVF